MTDERPTHLDDEALSAAHDGELGAAQTTHLEGCDHCSARLERLAAVSTLVATPVAAPADELRERTLANALAAFDETAGMDVRTDDLARRRGSPAPWFLGVAAALLLVVGFGAFGGFLGGTDDAAMTESAGDAAGGSADTLRGEEGVTAYDEQAPAPEAGPDGVIDGGDLGEIGDVAELRRAVAGSVDDWSAKARSGEADASVDERRGPGTDREEGTPAPRAATGSDGAPVCAEVLARLEATEGPLRVRALGSVDGRPALVYGLEIGSEPDTDQLRFVVVTIEDCVTAVTVDATGSG